MTKYKYPNGVEIDTQDNGSAVAFDIETTGLSANDEVISWAVFGDKIETVYSQTNIYKERLLLENLSNVMVGIGKDMTLISFNGQSYRGGFDFPLLRTRFHKHGIAWPFGGMMHVDIYPIIEKRWNTAIMPAHTLERLKRKDQLIEIAMELDIIINLKHTIAVINEFIRAQCSAEDISAAIIKTQDIKPIDINTLKGAYQIITGKDPGEMDGKESVKLWQQYQETGGSDILEQIRQYNLEDCQKTMELYEICMRYCSQRDMQPEIL